MIEFKEPEYSDLGILTALVAGVGSHKIEITFYPSGYDESETAELYFESNAIYANGLKSGLGPLILTPKLASELWPLIKKFAESRTVL